MNEDQDPVTLSAALDRMDALLAARPDDDVLEGVAADYGRYEGLPPRIELLEDGRMARLLGPIAYHRPDGTAWPVPAGSTLDGASIPRALWTLIGGPFEGKYRNASIVHDRYCDSHERRWQDTHRMFHDAMRCSGVGAARAGVMFYAVYRFGPRWADPALEGVAFAGDPAVPTDAVAESLLCDAEAIAEHGLSPDEIVALAEARDAATPSGGLEGVSSSPSSAELLVIAGGAGGPEDVAAVVAHARNLPPDLIRRFLRGKVRIVACRGDVTDFERELDGEIPRGWERTGRTWNSVPGAYFPTRKRVVIATIADSASGLRVVPDRGSGLHGSDDLVAHEAMHGYDDLKGKASRRDGDFRRAREADRAGLTAYELQDGDAGLEETFAETGAQHCVDHPALTQRCPRLAAYWLSSPAGLESIAAPTEAPTGPGPIGLAVREADGRLRLDLRATDDDGAIGHALIELRPGDRHHAALDEALFPADALEGAVDPAGRRTAPFFG
ncbi:MAG: DUF1353 domain-containing protein [Pseudomonadota bacterium]|nr:DUF1353 domain-containing protein [Pseudomonadota bacterium]